MMVDDTESCSSRSVESSLYTRKQRYKLEVYHQVLRRIKDSLNKEARLLSFDDELWAHFNRLPIRYALDVNVERAEDVLMHRRLLELAHDPANRPAFDVRTVKVSPVCEVNTHVSFASSSYDCNMRAMHEITFATIDKPKLLNQLTSLLSEIGLNIQEAHAFSTSDGYSLDVFFVDGWPHEEIEQLKNALGRKILKMKKNAWFMSNFSSSSQENACAKGETVSGHIVIPTDGIDVWEIDYRKLKFETKIASGSSGDLFKGNYCSQDVAIKVLKPEALNVDMQQEFAQEVYIMRKVRHKNVVQFIGACTRPPSLCIVTEFMSGGSVYDYLHKQNGVFRPPSLLKVAIDASRGMNYLHQNNIIHRDLKAANLLMDENEVVKVADFGVARIKAQPGVMTAETGTYRWMAPEVIEHKPYDHKADVFSFGIVLWELLTGKVPYECLTPLQAAVGVVQRGLRPIIPDHTHPKVAHLLERCWQQDPTLRPDFSEIIDILQLIAKEYWETLLLGHVCLPPPRLPTPNKIGGV